MNERELALKKANLTQTEVAKELGISKQSVNDVVKGRATNKKLLERFDNFVEYRRFERSRSIS